MANESDIIIREIEKTRKLYDEMDKYIIIKINQENGTDNKSFEFQAMFNGGLNA